MAENIAFIPEAGQDFMMAFGNGDGSYRDCVFTATRIEDRFVIAKMVVGYSVRDRKPYVFFRDQVTFFPCSEELREALIGEPVRSR